MFSWKARLERIDTAWRERPWCTGHLLAKPWHSSHGEHTHFIQATAPRAERKQRENWGSISSLVLYMLLWCLSGVRLTNHSNTVYTRQVIVWVVWFLPFYLLWFIATSLTGTAVIVVNAVRLLCFRIETGEVHLSKTGCVCLWSQLLCRGPITALYFLSQTPCWSSLFLWACIAGTNRITHSLFKKKKHSLK